MKIKSITADWLHVPIPEQRQHVTDFGRISSFDSTLVRIETECGIVGYGEARSALSSSGQNIALKTIIEQELGPLLIGEDPRRISRAWDIMYNGSRAHFALDRGHVFPALGRRGITICGISGIDRRLICVFALTRTPASRRLSNACIAESKLPTTPRKRSCVSRSPSIDTLVL